MSATKRGFQAPNHTQVPNDLFDELLPSMGHAELKVVLCIIRFTRGYHREKTVMSVRKIARYTGLTPRNVMEGAQQAEDRGLIQRSVDGNKTTTWHLVIESDRVSPKDTSRIPRGHASVSPANTQSRLQRKKENPKESAGGLVEIPVRLQAYFQACINKPIALPKPATKKEISAWLDTFEEWHTKGFTPAQVEAAGRQARRLEKVIARPASLTWLLSDGHSRRNGHEGKPDGNGESMLAKLASRSV